MIERQFVAQRLKEFLIQEFVGESLERVGHSKTKMQRTPLGEKIIVHASRPGLVVGRKGANIKLLTTNLKKKFELDNPQLEISEVEDIHLDAQIVAETIANTLERFGTQRLKGVGHKTMSEVMRAGARGVEILISGKIPSSRSKTWRFYQGYLKKCGQASIDQVRVAYVDAHLKSGTIGIQVRIMPPDVVLPDNITFKADEPEPEEEKKEGEPKKEAKVKEKKEEKSEKSEKKAKE